MLINQLKEKITKSPNDLNDMFELNLVDSLPIEVYTNSIVEYKKSVLFIGKNENGKYLYVISKEKSELAENLEGSEIKNGLFIKKCLLNTANRKVIQSIFEFTNPVVLGLQNSFGFGDRLGVANAGHIRSLYGYGFKPILAQQSIRELTRTNRTPEQVMDAAVWSVLQEGYKDGFGSDADHLKSYADIDLMLGAGFTMFTFDPSEHVDNEADNYDNSKLNEKVSALPWGDLSDTYKNASGRYSDKTIKVSDALTLNVTNENFLRGYAKYGRAIIHIKKMYDHLAANAKEGKFEVEVSVDETESVTSPYEHFFFASELTRLGVKYVSLAPRFIGDFEKGIDYKGDLDVFKAEYQKHLAIVRYFGDYKISLHSGSDKFSVYKVIGSLKTALTHVKTAGTSYLEALRVVAAKQPKLFRVILDFCRDLYEKEKQSYHVSADINMVKAAEQYNDAELIDLFSSNDARQVLHVTFGKVLTEKNENGKFLFKDDLMNCLYENEDTHYEFLINHFHKHLEPFN